MYIQYGVVGIAVYIQYEVVGSPARSTVVIVVVVAQRGTQVLTGNTPDSD